MYNMAIVYTTVLHMWMFLVLIQDGVMKKNPELMSSHRQTESVAMYGAVSSEGT